MIESWYEALKHVNVCVCASIAKVCKLGQSVKTHNHIMFQNQRNIIIPTKFVFHGIQRNTKATKRHFIMNMICTKQHKHNKMQKK